MHRFVLVLSSAVFAFSCLPVAAQEQPAPQAPPSPYTTVSGHITCGDTNHPARFAAVLLIPEKPEPDQASDWGHVKSEEDLSKVQAKHRAQIRKGTGLSAVSAIDGSFE